jgi:hypothetical protein
MAYILSKITICRTAFHKNVSFKSTVQMMCTRNSHLTNKTDIKAEQRFKLRDNISSNYKLIYREQRTINSTVVVGYCGGWLSLTVTLIIMGYLLYKDPPLLQESLKNKSGKEILKPLSKLGRITITSVGIALSILVIMVSKTIPFRIYHNPTEKLYKVVLINNVVGKAQILTFGEGTAVPKFRSKFLGHVLFDINGHTVLLDKESFPVSYVHEQMIRRTDDS